MVDGAGIVAWAGHIYFYINGLVDVAVGWSQSKLVDEACVGLGGYKEMGRWGDGDVAGKVDAQNMIGKSIAKGMGIRKC